MDRQVARREDKELGKILDKFVCVRVIQMYGVDLSLFQFDNDLTFAAFMLNADRTIYGRYGTKVRGNTGRDISLIGFRKALEGALDLHSRFPKVKKSLAGKTGPAPEWKTPETIPELVGRHKKGDVSSWGCIHCHTAHEGVVRSYWRADKPVSDRLLWKYPSTDVLGFRLDPNERATVKRVSSGSAAARAGLKRGDVILEAGGQPVISIADIQWVLHHAEEAGTLKAVIGRGEARETLSIPLTPGWRRTGSFIGRPRSMTGWFIQMTIPGMTFYDAGSDRRKQLGLSSESVALEVTFLTGPKSGWSKSALKAGIRKNDVIIEVDGTKNGMNAGDVMAYLLQKKKPGQKVAMRIRRGKDTLDVTLKLP